MSESDLDNLVDSIDLEDSTEETENGVEKTIQEIAPEVKVEQPVAPGAEAKQVGGARQHNHLQNEDRVIVERKLFNLVSCKSVSHPA